MLTQLPAQLVQGASIVAESVGEARAAVLREAEPALVRTVVDAFVRAQTEAMIADSAPVGGS